MQCHKIYKIKKNENTGIYTCRSKIIIKKKQPQITSYIIFHVTYHQKLSIEIIFISLAPKQIFNPIDTPDLPIF